MNRTMILAVALLGLSAAAESKMVVAVKVAEEMIEGNGQKHPSSAFNDAFKAGLEKEGFTVVPLDDKAVAELYVTGTAMLLRSKKGPAVSYSLTAIDSLSQRNQVWSEGGHKADPVKAASEEEIFRQLATSAGEACAASFVQGAAKRQAAVATSGRDITLRVKGLSDMKAARQFGKTVEGLSGVTTVNLGSLSSSELILDVAFTGTTEELAAAFNSAQWKSPKVKAKAVDAATVELTVSKK